MKIKLSALHDAIDFDYSPAELSAKLTDIGIEVESYEETVPTFRDVFVGRVTRTAPHPTHSKLTCVDLDLGTKGMVSVCTAATNVHEADSVPVVLPGGMVASSRAEITARRFGDMTSCGMLCSWRELGLESELLTAEEKDGILHLASDVPNGARFEDTWPFADTALNISITPDRGDALSVLGLARWIEILRARDEKRPFNDSNLHFHSPANLPPSREDGELSVSIENDSLCSLYIGVLMQDVVMAKPSCTFRNRLYKLGIRPVNSIVDVTNICLKAYGQPTHAFDYDRIQEHQIVVRPSRQGEAIVTLDGTARPLEPGMLIIADALRPIAVAGVMGGLETSVTSDTRRVVLEIAHFDPRAVAHSSRHLGLKTDAAYLFERGTDPGRTVTAVATALSTLVREQCVSSYISRVACAGAPDSDEPVVNLDLNRINGYLGISLSTETVMQLLGHEGIRCTDSEQTIRAAAPTFRGDLKSWPDYVEEVVRMQGYDEFPCHEPRLALRRGGQSQLKTLSKRARQLLVGMGLTESRTVSFVRSATVAALGLPPAPTLINPLIVDWDAMRPTLLIGLAGAAVHNLSRSRAGFASFEIGKVFVADGATWREETRLGILVTGRWQNANWTSPVVDADMFVLKGILEAMLGELHIPCTVHAADDRLFEAGGCAGVLSGSQSMGVFGILSCKTIQSLGLEQRAFYAELPLDTILACMPVLSFKEFSRFPAIRRDIAVLVDRTITAGQLQEVIQNNGGPLLKKVVIFDCFQGKTLPEGKKSVGFSLEFVSPDRTLLGDEVDALIKSIETALAQRLGGILRRT